MTAWEQVIERYANGRPICNCRQAYYSTDGTYWKNGQEHHDGLYCRHGCQANQIEACEHVAKTVLAADAHKAPSQDMTK